MTPITFNEAMVVVAGCFSLNRPATELIAKITGTEPNPLVEKFYNVRRFYAQHIQLADATITWEEVTNQVAAFQQQQDVAGCERYFIAQGIAPHEAFSITTEVMGADDGRQPVGV